MGQYSMKATEPQPTAVESIAVSELKNKLLEVVRRVEAGASFEITKGGHPVALLLPRQAHTLPVTGFAEIEVSGPLDLPEQPWSFDRENLPRSR